MREVVLGSAVVPGARVRAKGTEYRGKDLVIVLRVLVIVLSVLVIAFEGTGYRMLSHYLVRLRGTPVRARLMHVHTCVTCACVRVCVRV